MTQKQPIGALTQKSSQLGPQNVKNDPKMKSKSKVTIEKNIQNESCSTTLVDPKKVLNPSSIKPNNSPLGPQKGEK